MRTRILMGAACTARAVIMVGAVVLVGSPTAWAAFPGRNGKIAYTHLVGMSSAAIYAVNPGGGTPQNLSARGGGSGPTADFQPAWSATGKQIAFVRLDFKNCSGQIWAMRADGTGQHNLSNDAATASEFNPAFGPDGSIVFVRTLPGTFNLCSQKPSNSGDLWVRRRNGSMHGLTAGGRDNTPAWSPDGTKIAFTRLGPGGPHIFVMNANGTGAPTDLGPGLKPNWSPDGSKIVFAAPGAPNGPSGGPVTVMNADGSHRRTLTQNGTAPAWSPDGREIVFLTAKRSSEIAVMDTNGQHQHTITNPGKGNSDVKPDWQPLARRLKLSVSPHRTRADRRTCFHFRATSSGVSVSGVAVKFAHRHATTSGSGRATICATLSAGTYPAHATKPNYTSATAHVRVRLRKRPAFTG